MSAEGAIPVPGHPSVRVVVWRYNERAPDEVGLIYYGTGEDLIAAGVATPAMLEPNPKRGPKARRLDSEGEAFSAERSWSVRAGVPVRRFRLWRYKRRATALALPGGREALEAYEQQRRDRVEQLAQLHAAAQALEHRPSRSTLH